MEIQDRYIREHIISVVYKILCWSEERKDWQRLYDELMMELTMNNGLLDSLTASTIAFKVAPLKYLEGDWFRRRVFDIINYLNGIAKPKQK